MTRIKKGLIALAALAVLLAAFLVWIDANQPPISDATCAKIELGMTLTEVTDLIGSPPGNYRGLRIGRFKLWEEEMGVGLEVPGAASQSQWTGRQGIIVVYFDKEGKAIHKLFAGWPD